MDAIWSGGVNLVLWFQSLGAWLRAPMEFFTFLGEEQFFFLVLPALYWCVDARMGLRLGLLLSLNHSTNLILKLAFHGPRPFWLDTRVQAMRGETGFGAPSGHAQNAAAVWSLLAHAVKRPWAWAMAALLILLIGLSRIYLGMHLPHDVVLGWLFGAAFFWLFLRLEEPVLRHVRQRDPSGQVVMALTLSLLLLLIGTLVELSLVGWTIPIAWVKNAKAAGIEIAPLSLDGLITTTASFFGLSAGAIWMETRGGFRVQGAFWKRALRYVVGVVGVLVLWMGLGAVFPRGANPTAYALRYLRYGLVGGWVSGIAPWLFDKLRLL